jgi:MYXO-CTERM domain-containing protein
MSPRPQGIVNVASAEDSGVPQQSSSYGPAMTLAAYGNDTSTASGYVAALAAILRAGHGNWPAWQVVAQMAGSINSASGQSHTDRLGFGIIVPAQAVSQELVKPSDLPGFDALFPANQPAPSSRSVPTSSPSANTPSATPGSPTSPGSPTASSASGSAGWPTGAATTDSANVWPTVPVFSTGPSNGSHAAAGSSGGSGGFSPVLLIGFLVLVGAGGYILWQRRRQPKPAPVKPESEWEAPSGPRHSGYSPPEE